MENLALAESHLVRWGKWSSTREQHGIGYPSVCPTFKDGSMGSGSGAVMLVPADIMEVDAVVAALRDRSPDLFQVAMLFYVTGMPVQSVAYRCRCHRDTVYARLEKLRRMVNDAMCSR